MRIKKLFQIDGKIYRVIIETKFTYTLQNVLDKDDVLTATKPITNKEMFLDVRDKETRTKKLQTREA